MRSRDMENLRNGLALIRENNGSFIMEYDGEGKDIVLHSIDISEFSPTDLRQLYEYGFEILHDFDFLPEGCSDDPLSDTLLWAGFKRLLVSNDKIRTLIYDLK